MKALYMEPYEAAEIIEVDDMEETLGGAVEHLWPFEDAEEICMVVLADREDLSPNRTFLGTGTRKPWELTQDDVNQIWAEVLVLVAKGEPLTLPADLEEQAKAEQNSAMEKDEREGVVRLFLDTLLPANWDQLDLYQRREFLRGDDPTQKEGTVRRMAVSNMEIWCECFGRNREDLKPAESYALSSLMSRIEGWSRPKTLQTQALYGKQRVYLRE